MVSSSYSAPAQALVLAGSSGAGCMNCTRGNYPAKASSIYPEKQGREAAEHISLMMKVISGPQDELIKAVVE